MTVDRDEYYWDEKYKEEFEALIRNGHMLVDDENFVAVVDQPTFDSMPQYDHTDPTGKYANKFFKRHQPGRYSNVAMYQYYAKPKNKDLLGIIVRDLLVVE